MSLLPVLPLVLPAAGVGLSLAARRAPRLQRALGLAAALALVPTAIALLARTAAGDLPVAQIGGWPAPLGIALACDRLSALMLLLAGVIASVAAIYAWPEVKGLANRPAFYPLLHVLMLGVNGAFITGDLFNLYVWFEVLLIGSFGLLVLVEGRRGIEAALKALTLNLLGSLLFLVAAGATYGLAGTLNLADLHLRLPAIHAAHPDAVTAIAATLALAFALKAALFPLYFWLPASYHVPPAGICALFAAILTKVGIYALLRLFTLPFAAVNGLSELLLWISALTMLSGVLGAVTQMEMKRILAWHSISQVGYIAAGIGLLSSADPTVRLAGVTATIFFTLHHGLVKPALFLIAGLIQHRAGTTELRPLGGLAQAWPALAGLFLLAALSLAGIPPLSGFWAKLAVVRAAIDAGAWWALAAALGAGLLTLLSMLKIWMEIFWKPAPADGIVEASTASGNAEASAADENPGASSANANAAVSPANARAAKAGQRFDTHALPASLWGPALVLVALVTLIGLWPGPLLDLSRAAAGAVLDPAPYIDAVLGPGGSR